ncbi:MAG: two-component regulator propeller domain-containing protein, partial [Acidobacteriota bacterium]
MSPSLRQHTVSRAVFGGRLVSSTAADRRPHRGHRRRGCARPSTQKIFGCFVASMVLHAGVLSATTPDSLSFRQLTAEDGLSQSHVTSLIQDRTGYIWIGTSDGLNRYDGFAFEVFRHRRSGPSPLRHNSVAALLEAQDGAIWVGSRGGLDRYDAERDRWSTTTLTAEVTALAEGPTGELWIATVNGPFLLAPGDDSPQDLGLNDGEAEFPCSSEVRCVAVDTTHAWFGTSEGLCRTPLGDPPADGRAFQRLPDSGPLPGPAIPGSNVSALAVDADRRLWVGTDGQGLARSRGGGDDILFDAIEQRGVRAENRRSVRTLFIERGGRGAVWIGTENGGLDRYHPRSGAVVNYASNPRDPWSLSNNSVWSVLRDRSGALWVGTFAGGLNVERAYGDAIELYTSVAADPESLNAGAVSSFADDGDTLWVGTDGGGVGKLDRRTRTFTRFRADNSGLTRDAVLSLLIDDGQLWIGTWAGGLHRLSLETETIRAFTEANSDLPSDKVFRLAKDDRGRLWAATFGGLVEIDPAIGPVRSFGTVDDGFSTDLLYVVEPSGLGDLILGSVVG